MCIEFFWFQDLLNLKLVFLYLHTKTGFISQKQDIYISLSAKNNLRILNALNFFLNTISSFLKRYIECLSLSNYNRNILLK